MFIFQYDLVCSDQWKKPLISTIFFFGVLMGSFLTGQLSDKYWKSLLNFAVNVLSDSSDDSNIILLVMMFSLFTHRSGNTSCTWLFCLFWLVFIYCRFGRKAVLFSAIAMQSAANLLQIFSPSWTVFAIFFFINGMGRSSSYNAGFVLGISLAVLWNYNFKLI